MAAACVLLLAASGVCGASARADESRITLGPGTMTFSEIAQRLSTDGRQIACVPRLQECAAWVYIKGRTWTQTRDLLKAGLDIEIVPDTIQPGKASAGLDTKQPKAPDVRIPGKTADKDAANARWTLQRDPAATLRDTRTLSRYVDCLTRNMQSKARERLKTFALNKNADFVSSRQQFDDMDRENLAILFNPNSTKEDMERRNQLSAAIMALTAARPGNWILDRLLSSQLNDGGIEEAVRSTSSVHRMDNTLFPPEVLVGMTLEGQKFPAERKWRDIVTQTSLPADFAVWGGLQFDPSSMILDAKGGINANGDTKELPLALYGGVSYRPFYNFPPSDRADIVWAGLGEDANRQWDAQRLATRAFLSEEQAQKPFVLRTTRPVDSVSQVVEQWSRGLDAEAVMELLPTREPLHNTGSDLGEKIGVQAPQPGGTCRLSTLFSDKDAWTFERQEGVLMVRDVFAFVDRVYRYPFGAFFALERGMDRAIGKPDGNTENTAPAPAGAGAKAPLTQEAASANVRAMLAYARAVPVGQSAAWVWARNYRGVNNSTLTYLPPLLHLLDRLPRADVEQQLTALFRAAPAASDGYVLPDAAPAKPNSLLKRVDAREWERLLGEYRAMPNRFPNWAWNPETLTRLQECDLRASRVSGPTRPGDNIVLYFQYPDANSPWEDTLRRWTQTLWNVSPAAAK